MTLRYRYSLVAFIICVFFALAPLLVLYVRGQMPDSENGGLVQTGLIAVYTEPKDAELRVDGKRIDGSSPFSARFITKGDREVTITSPGFKEWKKKLLVESGRVTSIGSAENPIRLLMDSVPQNLARDVKDFVLLGNTRLAALMNNVLTIYSSADSKQLAEYKLPANGLAVMTNTQNEDIAVLGQESIFVVNQESGDVSTLKKTTGEYVSFVGDDLYFVDTLEKKLNALNVNTSKVSTVLENVASVAFLDDVFYALVENEGALQVHYGSVFSAQTEALIDGLSNLPSPKIFVNTQRQVFVWSGSILYRVDLGLTKLSEDVQMLTSHVDGLIIQTASELRFYDSAASKVHFVSRGDGGSKAVPSTYLGYVFAAKEGSLVAFEMDPRDNIQVFIMAKSGDTQKVSLSEDNRWLYWTEGGTLKRIELVE